MYCADFSAGDDKCHDGSEGDPCYNASDCQGEMVCSEYYGDACAPPAQEGDNCHDDDDCAGGLTCITISSNNKKCYDGSLGDPCDYDSDCKSGDCDNDSDICVP